MLSNFLRWMLTGSTELPDFDQGRDPGDETDHVPPAQHVPPRKPVEDDEEYEDHATPLEYTPGLGHK